MELGRALRSGVCIQPNLRSIEENFPRLIVLPRGLIYQCNMRKISAEVVRLNSLSRRAQACLALMIVGMGAAPPAVSAAEETDLQEAAQLAKQLLTRFEDDPLYNQLVHCYDAYLSEWTSQWEYLASRHPHHPAPLVHIAISNGGYLTALLHIQTECHAEFQASSNRNDYEFQDATAAIKILMNTIFMDAHANLIGYCLSFEGDMSLLDTYELCLRRVEVDQRLFALSHE